MDGEERGLTKNVPPAKEPDHVHELLTRIRYTHIPPLGHEEGIVKFFMGELPDANCC